MEADAKATLTSVCEQLSASTRGGKPDGPTISMYQTQIPFYDRKDFQIYRKMDQKSLENLEGALVLIRRVTGKYINLQPTAEEDLI